MLIDYERLHDLALEDNRQVATSLVAPLSLHLPASPINTPLRIAHFLAQACYETGFFSRLSENLDYTTPARIVAVFGSKWADRSVSLAKNPVALGNAVYANRMGNGDEESGDGYKFRGRAILCITGRYEYEHWGKILGLDLAENPDLAQQPDIAVRLAIAYWDGAGCNEAADRDSASGVTAKINPELEGLNERKFLTTRAKTIFV